MSENPADAQSPEVKVLSDKIGELQTTAAEISDKMTKAKDDSDAFAVLKGQFDALKPELDTLLAERAQKERDVIADQTAAQVKDFLADQRRPSKAHLLGPSARPTEDAADAFFATLAKATNPKFTGWDFEAMADAKAALNEMGSHWNDVPADSKATVGDTDAAGGYLVPNPVVLAINEQATVPRSVVDLFTPMNGVRGSSVDLPWEQDAIARAVIVAAGVTKENSNFIVNNYTATLYTLARIFDVGNQLLRQSEGAAERLVRSKLARAFALGEDYYALNGTGTAQPLGLLTAIGTSGDYVSTFSSPSDSTVAGSIIAAVMTAAGALADRGAVPDGVVLNSGDFYRMRRQGADAAGFWVDPFAPVAGIGQDVNGPLGLRWRHSPNMPTDSLVVGEYKDAIFIRGQGYRVDTSSEAGDRWDKNLTGFRGEEEIAFDARPSVYAGKFQRIVNAHA